MKCFVIASLLLISAQSLARNERQLLKCLGEEEKQFHLKKETGPLYDLNQRLISEMIQIPQAELDDKYFAEICSRKNESPSWKLLELSITKGTEIFEVPATAAKTQREMARGMIGDYMEATKEIFLNFLTAIQTLAPSAACLTEEIPELEGFLSDIKALQEDVDMKSIFAKRDVKIIRRLKDYPVIFKRCQDRTKKKLKSGSSAAAKKS